MFEQFPVEALSVHGHAVLSKEKQMNMFSNGSNTVDVFAKFNGKEGLFQTGSESKGNKMTFSQVRDVTITKIDTHQTEYEGKAKTDLRLFVRDGKGETACISFNVASGSTARLVGLLNAADLSKPLGLSGQIQKAGTSFTAADGSNVTLESDQVSCSLFQGDSYLKLEKGTVPKVVMVKVGSKDVSDTSARDDYVAHGIASLVEKMKGVKPAAQAAQAEPAAMEGEFMPADLDDGIPF